MQKLYSTNETAKILGYTRAAVIRIYIKRGIIKATKVGRDWMVEQKEIDRLKK